MKIETYIVGPVKFNYNKNKSWRFEFGGQQKSEFYTKCPGGFNKALQVAGLIVSSIDRCGEIDGIARHNIGLITKI